MSVCPNVSSKEWKNLVEAYGEDGAYKRWLQNGKEIPGLDNVSMGNTATLIKDLQKNVDGPVSINPDLDVTATLIKEKEQTRIEINTNLLQSENDIHEFGHVYVDLLGGLENHIIKAGLNRLKDSNLEKELRKQYPEGTIDEEQFQKELIAVAITKESKEIWKNNSEKQNAIEKWTSAFYKNLTKATGIKKEKAKKLSEDFLEDSVNKNRAEIDIEKELYERPLRAKPASPVSEKKKKLAEEALGIITSKVAILKRRLDPSNTGQAVVLAELIELQRSLQKSRADKALADFVSLAANQTETILKKFEEYSKDGAEVSLRTMQYLHSSMRAFDEELLSDIYQDLTEDQKELKAEINKVRSTQLNIHDAFKKVANNTLKTEFGDLLLSKTEAIFARKAEIEFQKNDRGEENAEKKQRRQEYIEKYLEDNAEEIEKANEERLGNFLTVIEKDISVFDSFVNNPKDMNSEVIRQVTRMFDEADFKTQEHSVFVARRAEQLNKDYTNFIGKINNQKEQWAPILETNKEGVTLPRLARTGSDEWAEIKLAGGKYKGTPVEEMYDFLVDLSLENDSKLPSKARLNGQLPVMNKNTFERIADGGVFSAIKEGTLDIFKLRKEDTESGELKDDSEEAKKEKIKASMDDTVKVLSTQAGEERKIIPVHFRGSIKETDRSYDVLSLMVVESHQAEDYKAKLDLAATVEVTLSLIGEAKVVQRSGLLSRVKANLDNKAQTQRGESNTYKVLERLIENRLYGIQTTGDAKTAKISKQIKSYVSIINLFGNYLSAGANFTQGLAMVFMEGAGKQFYGVKNVMNAEAKYFKDIPSNVADASRQRAKGKTNLLRELFNAQSDWNVLENDFNKNNGLKRNANMGTGLALNSAAEHSAQSIGMYSVLDNIKVKDKDGNYITKEGTVTKNREEAMSLDEAYEVGYQNTKTKKTISQEAYDKLSETEKKNYMDGVLHLNEKVASTDRTKDEGTFEVSQVLRRVNRDLFGNYDPKNRSRLEAHAIGSFFSHMRQWMVPGFKKRYKGGHALFIRDKENAQKLFGIKTGLRTVRSDELRDVDLDYNVETGQFEEGMYITTMRWVGVMLNDVKALKFKVLSESWKNLTEYEKSNIRRTTSELAMAAAAYITFVVLASALEDDDEEDKFAKMMVRAGQDGFRDEKYDANAALIAAFYSRRLLSELMTYTSPTEWARTFRSPAVTLSLLENIIKALHQTATSPLEEYKTNRGGKKGENKAVHYWMKVTPLKIIDKDVDESLKFLMRNY